MQFSSEAKRLELLQAKADTHLQGVNERARIKSLSKVFGHLKDIWLNRATKDQVSQQKCSSFEQDDTLQHLRAQQFRQFILKKAVVQGLVKNAQYKKNQRIKRQQEGRRAPINPSFDSILYLVWNES